MTCSSRHNQEGLHGLGGIEAWLGDGRGEDGDRHGRENTFWAEAGTAVGEAERQECMGVTREQPGWGPAFISRNKVDRDKV